MNTRFLNVDLELVATTDLQPLLAHLEASTIELEVTVYALDQRLDFAPGN